MDKTGSNKSEERDLNKLFILSFVLIVMMTILAMGCTESDCQSESMMTMQPVFAAPEDVMTEARFSSMSVDITAPGKIYLKDEHLFITETDKGIHVIDNRDPHNPTKIGFIEIPGTKDLAAKGDYLYADNYVDLVVLDISDKQNIKEVSREKNVFDSYYYIDVAEGGIMVDQEEVEVEIRDCEGNWVNQDLAFFRDDIATDVVALESSAGAGQGGSLARFTIKDQYLYTINDWRMKIFDIQDGDSPVEGNEVDLGWGIETIFPYEDKLFLGARSGMHIYDNANPSLPEYVSTYEHINTCDPVVVQGDYAYVTLRNGTECQTFTNQLDVIDISDIMNPTLVETFDMINPHGLGIIGECLFICEGDHGIKLFNASDPLNIGDSLIVHHDDVHALDVIPTSDVLMMIGDGGLHQYEYDCEERLELISSISF